MYKSIKYELKPNKTESVKLDRTFWCVRFVYNRGLERKTSAYATGTKLSCFDLSWELTKKKKEEWFEWLREVWSQQLQQTLGNLDNAFSNFFRRVKQWTKQKWFPKFHKKGQKESFRIAQAIKIDYEKYKFFVPKIGYIKFYQDKQINGTIKFATVSKTPTNRYFVSITYETQEQKAYWTGQVGIDFGIKDFAITSDNQIFENQKYLRNNLAKLRIAQRKLTRKFKKWSKEQSIGYAKQKFVVAKLHEKIANQRKDYIHKFSTTIATAYETVCIENLNIEWMSRNHKLALSIKDCGRWMARQLLEYKVKDLRVIGRFEPSSQICNICWYRNRELKLKDRKRTCVNGHVLDRDINAAINIKNFGLRASTFEAKAV